MSSIITISQFAQMFNVPGTTVRQWIIRYHLPVIHKSIDNRTSELGMIDLNRLEDWLYSGYALIPSMNPKHDKFQRMIHMRRMQLENEWITVLAVAQCIQRLPEVKTNQFLRQVDIDPVFRLNKLFFHRETMAQKLKFLVADEQIEDVRRIKWLAEHLC